MQKRFDGNPVLCLSPDMPLVQLDLTDEEAKRVDAVADREKRARKNQIHIMAIERLEQIESATKEESKP